MRDITRIILHCSAKYEGQDVSAATIKKWHTSPPRNWSDIGYHYVVRLDGTIEQGRPLGRAGAHTRGHNKDSVGICYIGGVDACNEPKNTMTDEQRASIKRLCLALCLVLQKPLTLHGHREYAAKACPSFEVADEFAGLIERMAQTRP
jgi:N-acetylmuramoyl-L-alanine amidase